MDKKSFISRLFMPQKELEAYYQQRRLEDFEAGLPIPGVKWRGTAHSVIRILLKLERLVCARKIRVIGNTFHKTDKPIIFACTHVGRYDIEVALELIHQPVFFFMGDPGEVYKSFDGLFLWLNGTLFTDTDSKTDRHVGKENCVKLLQQGGNVLIYPEGAWNISENQMVTPLFNGTAEMAIRTDAQIVPIAIEQYGKEYYVNIGTNISAEGYTLDKKQELTDLLRDTLCTLKWEIFTHVPPLKRAGLPDNAADLFLESIMSQTENGYTLEEILRTRYHVKMASPQEAFAHLQEITPKHDNAFLFGKHAG